MRKFIFILLAACMLTACTTVTYDKDPIAHLVALEMDVDDPTRYYDIEALPKKYDWRLNAEFRAQVSPQFEEKCVDFLHKLIDAYTLMQSARGEENGLIGTYGITFEDITKMLVFRGEPDFVNRLVEESSEFGFSAQLVAESLNRVYSYILAFKAQQSLFEAEMEEWPDSDDEVKRELIESYERVIPLRRIKFPNDETASGFDFDRANMKMQTYLDHMDRSFIVCLMLFE